jgi:large subunit ribosomal protein L21
MRSSRPVASSTALPSVIGKPLLENATVKATVIGEGRGDKVHIFKMRRRKHYRRSQGHRQSYTMVRIDTIQA